MIDGRAEDVTLPSDPLPASTEISEPLLEPGPSPLHNATPLDNEPSVMASERPIEPALDESAESIRAFAPRQDETDPSPSPTREPPRAEETIAAPASTLPDTRTRAPWAPLAALAFAVLAAGLLYVYSQLSSLPPDTSGAVGDLRTRVSALESRPSSDTAGLGDRLAKLEHTLAEAQDHLDSLGKRIDGVAATLAQQAKITGQVGDLTTADAGLRTDLAGLRATVAALPRPDIGRIETRLGDLDGRLASLQGAVSSIPHVDLGPLTGKIDSLDARMKPIEAEASAAQAPEQIAQRRAAPVAVTAQAIVGAIDAGQAFTHELDALQVLGTDPAKLAPLKAVAETGAPSLSDLQATLAEMRDRIVTRGTQPPAGSYMDKLVAGASALVQVRPLGSVVGDTPSAIVSRMSDAIGRDDLAQAIQEWHKLPAASQEASRALADRIRLRLDAEQAAKDIAANAIGAMAPRRG